ncbi:DinB family protein [Micromonospora sp. NBC_01392]|uniref:DinB family protein n=1 Tax=Micromonospora sp. NBC_01392 TaxID=2903588 RepID=UPI00324CDCEC
MADIIVPDTVARDFLATFERARTRLFDRLEGLTDDEYLWEPASDCVSIRLGNDGTFRVTSLFPESSPEVPDPITTIAWRVWHIGALCLRGYVMHFFEDVPEFGDRHEWPGTAKEGVQALAEHWDHFHSRIAALSAERLLAPIGRGPGGWVDETYLKLALKALVEVTHHGGEIGLLRDLYSRQGV